jgi:hypothetical protein
MTEIAPLAYKKLMLATTQFVLKTITFALNDSGGLIKSVHQRD